METVKLSDLIAPAFIPVHRAVANETCTHYWLKGGRLSGKSSFISIEIVQGLMRNPGSHAIVYRKVACTLADSVVAQCKWAACVLGVQSYWRFQKSPQELIFKPTGQRILFKGADDAEKSKGIKLEKGYFKYIWFEELTEFDGMEEIETIIRSLVREQGHSSVFYSYNPPKSLNNWVNAECLVPRASRMVHHSSYKDLPAAWLNPQILTEAEELKARDELKYRWVYMGEATGTGGAVFDNLKLREITGAEASRFDRLYDGLDFGFAVDPSAYIVTHYEPQQRRLTLLCEFYAVRASYDRIAAEIKKYNPVNRVVTADSAEPRSIEELRGRGIKITGAKKGPGSVEHGISWLQDLSEIVADPARTPNAAREFSTYEYEQDRYGNFKAAYPDGNNHTVDAVRYGLESVTAYKRIKTIEGLKL